MTKDFLDELMKLAEKYGMIVGGGGTVNGECKVVFRPKKPTERSHGG